MKAFPCFQNSPHWKAVAKYLYGNGYRAALNLGEEDTTAPSNETSDEENDNVSSSQSIENFVEEFIHVDEDDHSSVAAFNLIQSYVSNDKVEEVQANAEEMATALSKPTLTAVVTLLLERLPRSQQKKVATEKAMQKEIAKWLQSPNIRREFMFRTTNNLKDLIGRKNIKVRGSKTIERMIDALAGTGDQTPLPNAEQEIYLEPADAAIKAIISKSFLPHQKGEAREACTMGHILERPVLEKWIQETTKRGFPVRSLKVNGAYSAGLVEKQDSPWAKDSIDFILTVSFHGMEDHHAWGVEIKSRVNAKTAADEEEFVANFRNKHEEVEAAEVHKMIKAVSERFQILHHAYVYDFDKILFAVGDSQSEILQSTIVNFDEELKDNYGRVLKDLKDLALGWAYGEDITHPIKLPEKILEIGKTLPQIKDDEALEGSANLWLALMSKPLPMPSLTRLIPAVCAYWNAVKSGSDTTTKLMDDRVLYPPHVNCETIASTRIILLAFVLIHRLLQMDTASQDLQSYPTLSHYRNAASHRTTFQKTILCIQSTLSRCLQKQSEIFGETDKENHNRTIMGATRSLPSRQRVHGVLPEAMTFGVTLPFITPKKIKKQVEKGQLSESICQMYQNCTGRLVQVVDNEKRKQCALCSKLTSYYCAGCKSWFCFSVRLTNKKKNNEECNLKMIHHNLKGKREIFFESCFVTKHKDAWKTEDEKTSAAIATP